MKRPARRAGRLGRRHAALAVAALCFASCTASNPRTRMRRAFEREIEPLPVVAVQSPDGQVTLDAEALEEPWIAPLGAGGTLYSLEVPIADGAAIHCLVLPAEYQLARLVAGIIADEPPPPVSERHVLALDVGMMGERPFVLVETTGLVAHGDRDALFEIKVAGVSLGLSSLVCVLDEVGYRATFRRIVGGIAESIRVDDGGIGRAPDFHEVLVSRLDERVAGFVETRFHRTDDGAWATLVRSHLLRPTHAGTLTPQDSIEMSKSAEDGRLLREFAALEAPDGDAYELDLYAEGNAYAVVGRAGGAPVESEFVPPAILTGERRLARALASGEANSPAEPWQQQVWLPAVDPSGATTRTVRRLDAGSRAEARYEIQADGERVVVEIDADGSTLRREAGTLVQERIFVRGHAGAP